jgi:hypothetical protein
VKVTENNVLIPGITPLCDQELKTDGNFNYTVVVNNKKYETAVELVPRSVVADENCTEVLKGGIENIFEMLK